MDNRDYDDRLGGDLSDNDLDKVSGGNAGIAALNASNDFLKQANEGLGLSSDDGNTGSGTYAGMGGGSIRQETG